MAKLRKSGIKKDMILNFGGDIKDCADLFYAGDWEIYLDMGSIPYPLKEDSTIDYQGWLNIVNNRVRGAWGNLNVSLSPVTGEYKAWLDYGRTQDERNTKEYSGTVTGLDSLHLTNDIGNMVWNDYCMLNGIEKSAKKSKNVKKGIGYSDDVAVNLQGARDYVDMAIDCLKRVPVGNQWLRDADMGIENDVSSAMNDLSYAFNSITSAMDFIDQNYTASAKKSKVDKTKVRKMNVTEIEVNGEPYYIWQHFDDFKGSRENPDQYVTNARAVLDFKRANGFNSIQDVIDYIKQYFTKSTKKSKSFNDMVTSIRKKRKG